MREPCVDILLPTYNRAAILATNLEHIGQQIQETENPNRFRLIVSDNCSTDHTREIVKNFQAEPHSFSTEYHRQPENVGLEANMAFLLQACRHEYMLWVGDDDFFASGYLAFLEKELEKNPDLGCVITGVLQDEGSGPRNDPRPTTFKRADYPAGYHTALEISHYGHQLSGLLLKAKGLADDYFAQPEFRTPYLFIYFATNRCLRYDTLFVPCYKTVVSIGNAKAWGYNDIGLLDEVFKAYYAFEEEIGPEKVVKLIHRFCVQHSYRLAFQAGKLPFLVRQMVHLLRIAKPLPGLRSALIRWCLKEYLRCLLKGS